MHPNLPAPARAASCRIPLDHTLPAHLRGPGGAEELARQASGRSLPVHCRDPGIHRAATAVVSALWQALIADFRAGLRITRKPGQREIRFLRSVVHVVNEETGRIEAYEIRDGRRQQLFNVPVGTPLVSWAWVDPVLECHRHLAEACRPAATAFVLALTHRKAPVDTEVRRRIGGIWSWAKTCVEAALRCHVDWRELRRQLSTALALDPAVLLLARRALRPAPRTPLSHRDYNDCLRYRHHLERVAQVAPALLPALGWLIQERHLSVEARPLSVLKRKLREQEATPADWLRLLVDPARPVWRLYRAGRLSTGNGPLIALAWWARIHRGLAAHESLPLRLFELILQTGAEPINDRVAELMWWEMPPVVLSAGLARARRAIAEDRFDDFVTQEWMPVLTGYAYDEPYRLSRRLRSWPKVVQRALECEQLALARLRSSGEAPWPVPAEAVAGDAFEARFLRSVADLAEEGIAMRHCGPTLADECRTGKLLMASIRDIRTGRRVATMALEWDERLNRWRMHDVKGFANQPVPLAVRHFTAEVVRKVALAATRVPEPPPVDPAPPDSDPTLATPTFSGAAPRSRWLPPRPRSCTGRSASREPAVAV